MIFYFDHSSKHLVLRAILWILNLNCFFFLVFSGIFSYLNGIKHILLHLFSDICSDTENVRTGIIGKWSDNNTIVFCRATNSVLRFYITSAIAFRLWRFSSNSVFVHLSFNCGICEDRKLIKVLGIIFDVTFYVVTKQLTNITNIILRPITAHRINQYAIRISINI